MKPIQSTRRRFLKTGVTALAMIPVALAAGHAGAATNAAMRAALKYQPKPEGDKKCGNCLQFVPGASATAPGGCKILAGDTEVSAQGYCSAWVKKA